MKTITVTISIPLRGLQDGKKFVVDIADDANIVDVLAQIDKQISDNLSKSVFPIYEGYIHNYLQLFINLENDDIYEDVGISAYGPDEDGILRRFNPIRDDIYFNLYPGSEIDLQPDAGCWWAKVKNRLDKGRLKNAIRKKYGKDNELFTHYFK